ncbi:MAG: acetoacetate--CoA ligase [Pseudomonadota bacterium]
MSETFEEAPIIWTPSRETVESSEMMRFMRWLKEARGLDFPDYAALWEWSTTDLEGFWTALRDFWDLRFSAPERRVLDREVMPGATWFEGARLNYADQIWRHLETLPRERDAIRWRTETAEGALSWGEMADRAGALARNLRKMGVKPGDRVAAILQNGPESLIAFLAVVSVGGVWSLCSPDMGATAILDRFRQIDPKVLITADGYVHNGRAVNRTDLVAQVREGLPGLAATILAPRLPEPAPLPEGAVAWEEMVAGGDGPPETEQVDFAHPLWIVYSSGTTGNPKPIVHGHGGALLEGMKFPLHNDIRADDVFMWLTASGWIMWNTQLTPLTRGATLAIFDGAPNRPDMGEVWRFLERAGVTFFGAGAAYFAACIKDGVVPREVAGLSQLRAVGATGSPLAPEAYDWILEKVKPGVWIVPISGGTDFAGAFVGGCILLPLRRGEMQCRFLGARVEAWDEQGNPLENQVGELVCTKPMPSMPLFFWGDEDGSRLRESYFETYPGVWRHGDWIRITPSGGAVIYGRSDATINRRGLRIGSSEIYRAVEGVDEVMDSLVVDLEFLGRESFMPLFVVMREGHALDEAMKSRILDAIRQAVSARYLPDEIVEVPEIPRTLSGKKLEVPVKKLLLGAESGKAVNRDSMANPDAFDAFVAYAEARGATA